MKIIFPTDEHQPYVDKYALAIAMKIAQDFDPDIRIAGSDGMDFYAISRFRKNPDRLKEGGLQAEINAWVEAQQEWRDATPNAKVKFLRGNHELRLEKFVWDHPELIDLLTLKLENVLQLKKLHIQLLPNDEFVVDNLMIQHGEYIRKHSGWSAKASLESLYHARHLIVGHSHRGGSYYATTVDGIVQAHEGFCLCSLEVEYIRRPNWQQGITLATVEDGITTVESVPFFNDKKGKVARWRDKEYRP